MPGSPKSAFQVGGHRTVGREVRVAPLGVVDPFVEDGWGRPTASPRARRQAADNCALSLAQRRASSQVRTAHGPRLLLSSGSWVRVLPGARGCSDQDCSSVVTPLQGVKSYPLQLSGPTQVAKHTELSLLLSVGVRSVGKDCSRGFGVRFVDEKTSAAREVERVGTSGVVGSKPRLDSRRYERCLGELRVASCGVGTDLDHRPTPRGGCLR